MDYIYKNSQGAKKVGEIKHFRILFYDFEIKSGNKDVSCQVYRTEYEWQLKINNNFEISLATLDDIYWNKNSINETVKNSELSSMIAYAINAIYQKAN